ncbi:NAD(P)-binding protein [Auricularia subglabra TFB-10046 SS5]|nr:NAD(P)-binding protein [Auricularia subglabra TFB-10046 SS5]
MRAAVLTTPGAQPSTAFRIDEAYPKPTLPSRGADSEWLLVRVHAAGLNRAELRSRAGDVPHPAEFGPFAHKYRTTPPAVLGEEFVGVVEDSADGVRARFPVGALVVGFGAGGGKAFDGAYAQYTLALARRCWRFEWPGPVNSVPWDVVAAVPVAMWTAHCALFEAADTKKGDTVLVHGATSSVGLWAVMLAKHAGCAVIATTRQAHKVGRLRTAGADYVLLEDDLKDLDNVRKLAPGGVNTIFELVGPSAIMSTDMPLLARKGTVVASGMLDGVWSIADFTPATIPSTRRLTFSTTTDDDMETVGQVLPDALDKVRTGVYKSEIFLDKVFALEEVGKAHEYMEESRAVGKVVLRIP